MQKEIRKRKSQRGITLVALVITIIVLLILAGISLNAVVGENGLLERAKESRSRIYWLKNKERVYWLI